MKPISQHARVKVYQKHMKEAHRCGQCIKPWHDGICLCKKWGPEQEKIRILGLRLVQEGWIG